MRYYSLSLRGFLFLLPDELWLLNKLHLQLYARVSMITLNVFPDEMVRFYKNEGLEYAEKALLRVGRLYLYFDELEELK